MKTVTALMILLLLVFSVEPAALPQESTGQGNAVIVAWQVNIDKQRDFDFSRLRVLIQYRPGKGYAWTALPLTKPDSTGRFVATVLAGNYLSLQIGTEDPTVRRTLVKSTAANNYVVSEGIPPTIFEQEMYIAPGPTRGMERSLELQLGAAFTLCIPPSLKSGSIQFYERSRKSDGVTLISFSDAEHFNHAVVGGLLPGRWVVKYLDDRDAVVLSQLLELNQGELMKTECRSGFLQSDAKPPVH